MPRVYRYAQNQPYWFHRRVEYELFIVSVTLIQPNGVPNNPSGFTALIGLDWGDKAHAIALQPADGSTETSTLEHSAESLHQWLDQLEKRFGARPVAIAIETNQGAVVFALLERPWITIFPIP